VWEGQRFCGRCGHALKPGVRFCGNCGYSAPESAGQATEGDSAWDLYAGQPQAADSPAYFPTITAVPTPPVFAQPFPASDGRGDDFFPGAATGDLLRIGSPPSAPPSAPPGPGVRPSPRRSPGRWPGFGWPLAVALILLVAGGGTAAALSLTRHPHAKPGAQRSPVAVSSTIAATASPSASPSPSPIETTASPSPSSPPTQVTIQGVNIGIAAVNTDPDVGDVEATLGTYFGGIDARNYSQAWDAFTPAFQAGNSFQSFSQNDSTTQDSQIVVQSIKQDPNGDLEATVSFQSHQAPQDGPNPPEACTNWSLDYHLAPASAGSASLSYLINEVKDVGAGNTPC
jgi:hypothetical protein